MTLGDAVIAASIIFVGVLNWRAVKRIEERQERTLNFVALIYGWIGPTRK